MKLLIIYIKRYYKKLYEDNCIENNKFKIKMFKENNKIIYNMDKVTENKITKKYIGGATFLEIRLNEIKEFLTSIINSKFNII